MKRRTFIKLLGLGGVGTAAAYYWPNEGFFNPCFEQPTPARLLNHELLQSAWEGINPESFWDMHTHLIGTGDGESGIYLHPSMQDIFSPAQYVRFKFYLNASCADNKQGVDVGYVIRLKRLLNEFPRGAKSMLLAFDYHHDTKGRRVKELSPFYTPNHYAQKVAKQDTNRFEWIASIHPYREDGVEALNDAVANGASALKWLPPIMGIDPSSPRCDRFYAAMVKHDIPLLTHAGDEHAVAGVDAQVKGNPLLLRRPLEHGVRVIVAHCASQGVGHDLDKGKQASSKDNFELFARLMDEKQYEGKLFGDISAVTQLNRIGPALQTIIVRDDWHHRLLNGSDYPLPGVMPLYSTTTMYEQGYISQKKVKLLEVLRQYNPLLFDFVLKRNLRWQGKALSESIFKTRQHFKSKHSKAT